MKNKKPILKRMKRSIFISKLNKSIEQFGAKARIMEERVGADIIEIVMDKMFLTLPLTEENYNELYILTITTEIGNQKARINLQK